MRVFFVPIFRSPWKFTWSRQALLLWPWASSSVRCRRPPRESWRLRSSSRRSVRSEYLCGVCSGAWVRCWESLWKFVAREPTQCTRESIGSCIWIKERGFYGTVSTSRFGIWSYNFVKRMSHFSLSLFSFLLQSSALQRLSAAGQPGAAPVLTGWHESRRTPSQHVL